MQVEQRRLVGEDWVDVNLLDVREVRDGVLWQLEVAHVLDGAVVTVNLTDLGLDDVEVVPALEDLVKSLCLCQRHQVRCSRTPIASWY